MTNICIHQASVNTRWQFIRCQTLETKLSLFWLVSHMDLVLSKLLINLTYCLCMTHTVLRKGIKTENVTHFTHMYFNFKYL